MASADVRSPCGEFAKCQGIIHFAFSDSRKLRYSLSIKSLIPESVPFSTVRTLPGNMVAGHAPDILVHTCLANGKSTPAGPIEWGDGLTAGTGNILSATNPGPFDGRAFFSIRFIQSFSSLYKSDPCPQCI
jgi:hypothetical protein